jgi:hypothetical protein
MTAAELIHWLKENAPLDAFVSIEYPCEHDLAHRGDTHEDPLGSLRMDGDDVVLSAES